MVVRNDMGKGYLFSQVGPGAVTCLAALEDSGLSLGAGTN